MNWDAPAVERARELWAAGWSAGSIAREFKCTKNSVMGMRHRQPGFAARPNPIARKGPAHWTRTPPTVRVMAPVVLVLPPAPIPPPVVVLPVRIGACRWPLWTDATPRRLRAFCGEIACDGPYCPTHHALGHIPTARGRRVA